MIRFQVSLESHHLTWYMLAYMLVCKAAVLFFFFKYNKKYYCKKYFWYKRLFGIFIKLVKIKLILESLDMIFYLAQFKIKLY
jgi:hypothetical protein